MRILPIQKWRLIVKYSTLECSRKTVYSDRKNNNNKNPLHSMLDS